MVEQIENPVCHGVAGRRVGNVKGVVIHNDAGSMTAKQYVNWLANKTVNGLTAGFAHYYGDRNTMARVEDTYNMAWHTANPDGNANYIGYEVCQSMSASTEDFLANEQAVFKQVAEDLKYYGLPVNRDTVRLHKEFSSTDCPHRSWDLHGQSVNAVKDYFISQISIYYNGGTVDTTDTTNTTDTTEEPKLKEEEVDMTEFAFAHSGCVYYVTGSRMVALANATEWEVVQAMYAQTHGGRPILALDWSNNGATADAYFNLCGRADDVAFKQATTTGIEDIKESLKQV